MKRAILVSLAIGAFVGATGVLGLQSLHLSPARPNNHITSLETVQLGTLLMARVGKNFVADSRQYWPADRGVNFFASPKPYGSWLCRVDIISVDKKIVNDSPSNSKNFWDDDIAVQTGYGIWTSPTSAASDNGREKACYQYRDFEHLFFVNDSMMPERAAFLIDKLISDAKRNKFTYSIQCSGPVDDVRDEPRTCDGRSVLAGLNFKQLNFATNNRKAENAKTVVHEDELQIDAGSASDD